MCAGCGFQDVLQYFYDTIKNGSSTESEAFLKEYEEVLLSPPGKEKNFAAYCAAQGGHLDLIIWFDNVFPSAKVFHEADKYDHLVAIVAIEFGHLRILKYLHQQYPSELAKQLTDYEESDFIALTSAKSGKLDVLDWLLKTFPDQVDRWLPGGYFNLSLLFQVQNRGHLHVLQYFQKYHLERFDFTAPLGTHEGTTLVYKAATSGHLSILEWLFSTFPGKWSLNALDQSLNNILWPVVEKGHLDVLKYFHQYSQVDFLHTNRYGCNLLHLATGGGQVEIVKWLLAEYPLLLKRSMRNGSEDDDFLHLAISKGHLDVFRAIWDFTSSGGSNTFVPTSDQRVKLLHTCSEENRIDIFDWIITSIPGPWNLTLMDAGGLNIAHKATGRGHLGFLQHLYEHFFNHMDFFAKTKSGKRQDTIWTLALEFQHLNILKWCLEAFPSEGFYNLNFRRNRWKLDTKDNNNKWTIFHLAAQEGDLELLQHLARNYLRFRYHELVLIDKDGNGWTAFRHAQENKHINVTQWIKSNSLDK